MPFLILRNLQHDPFLGEPKNVRHDNLRPLFVLMLDSPPLLGVHTRPCPLFEDGEPGFFGVGHRKFFAANSKVERSLRTGFLQAGQVGTTPWHRAGAAG